MRTKQPVNVATTAIVSVVVSVVFTTITLGFGSSPARGESLVDTSYDDVVAAIEARLEQLAERVETRAPVAVSAPVRVVRAVQRESSAVVNQASDASARRTLAEFRKLIATAPGRVARHLAPNWYALTAFRTLAKQDAARAKRQVGLMTVPELVRRFGYPTRIQHENGALALGYRRKNPTSQKVEVVRFHLVDGYVASFQTEEPRVLDLGSYFELAQNPTTVTSPIFPPSGKVTVPVTWGNFHGTEVIRYTLSKPEERKDAAPR